MSDASASAAADSAIQANGGNAQINSSNTALWIFIGAVAAVVGFIAWHTRKK